MVSQTTEKALEECIEQTLTGQVTHFGEPAVGEVPPPYGSHAGYVPGDRSDFNAEYAVDTEKFWQFLRTTQPEQLDKLSSRPEWERLVLERLSRKVKKDGILKVLKKGLDIDDAHLTLLYSLPFHDINPEQKKRFEQNIFSVTRQVHYSQADPNLSLDMALFINGLPLATVELKNAWTGQTVYHARKQYQNDRDPNEPLLNFGRCIVHLAVDTDEVYMTTRLNGKKTHFLPFNKGHNFGKGNPPNPVSHKTAYLWNEVLTRESLVSIIEHFAKLVEEKNPKTGKTERTLYFPRYHQLEVVRKILAHAEANGTGNTYLIQHSAGSGKSHSITWLAYQLIELYERGSHRAIFDSVVIVTDRRVLDRQLKNNIKQFAEVKNIVAHATSSQELKQHLENGKKIIITTIQKFPFIVAGMDDLSANHFAVIIDEAHSSQSGSAADTLTRTLGSDDDEEPEDIQDKILKLMEGRKLGSNASYFAFTATPKNATLEKFGEETQEGKFVPFHLYSMKQAIEEGFILDVLANYTTYKSYYEIKKSIADNPFFDTAKAQKKLRAYVEGDQETIAVKADIIVSHFLEQVVIPKKLRGQAKAMVVTRNIRTAILYHQAIREALKNANAPFKAMVAFSGKKSVDGVEYTEDLVNGFPGKDMEENFDTDEYRLLVVANKFLTGFDQPKLSTMYIDKKLQGVLAVQALSRLNRCNQKLGKRTEDMFVLDFFNSPADIKKAFDPFYTSTSLSEATDVNVLHDVKDKLDESGVYEGSEVEHFNDLYFNHADAEKLSPVIDLCANRFNHELELEEDDKVAFKVRAKQFVKVYAQVASIIPFNNIQWEMLHWFLKFMIPKLKVKRPTEGLDELLDSVDLSTYGLERRKLKETIGLDASESDLDPQNPNPRGAGLPEEKDPLDEIIKAFNERFFAGWDATPEEQRVKFVNIARHVVNNPDYQAQVIGNADEQNRRIALEKMIKQAVSQERRRELDLYKHYAGDTEFKHAFDSSIMRILLQSSGDYLQQQFGFAQQ